MSSSQTAASRPAAFASCLTLSALTLPAVLLTALAIRVAVVWTQTYVVWVDETFQYFEQGHRLAFGSGLVPWEFQEGARSWLLPGLIAGVMRLSNAVSDDPLVYVRAVRLLCVAMSLSVVLAAFRAGERRDGLPGAIVAGGFCAIWFDLLWFAPTVLTEVLAAHIAILALLFSDRTEPRRSLLAGGLFGLAFCLRYQYAPALLAAMLWRNRLSWRAWRWLAIGGLAVVLPVAGVLDWVTWGSPFQSIWLNAVRNAASGISAGMGVEPAWFYLSYLDVALRPWPVLVALAVVGGFRAPGLALMGAVTLLEHSLIPHKEVRFIYLTIAVLPILIGLGLAEVARYLCVRFDRRFASAAAVAFLAAGMGLSWWTGAVVLGPRWQFDRANALAFRAAHDEPGLCGLAVRDVWFWESGGYTWLHRDVPLWFADDDPARTLPGTDRPLGLVVMRDGGRVARIQGGFGAATARYSHMIAQHGHAEPGYTPVACFNDVARHGEPDLCLFRRPGGCS